MSELQNAGVHLPDDVARDMESPERDRRIKESMICPNCGSTMNVNDPCPECNHWDGDGDCQCSFCVEERALTDKGPSHD